MARPPEAALGGVEPSRDGCGDRNVCSELTNSAPDLDEFPEDLELLLFFEDYTDVNPKPFLF